MARAKKARAGGGAKKRAVASDKKNAARAAAPARAKAKPAKAKPAKAKPAAAEARPARTAAAGRKRRTGASAEPKAAGPKTAKKTKRRTAPARTGRRRSGAEPADPTLFASLTEGERADALRVLTEDKRLSQMAKVGRYRVVSIEPLTVKPPGPRASRRLARVVIYDYASDRSVDASVDLDASEVAALRFSRSQPMLAREEEAAAIAIALSDDRVKEKLSLGDEAQVAMHYWSDRDTDLAFTRRSAAVMFGAPGNRPSLVAVVDLLDAQVTDVVPASHW